MAASLVRCRFCFSRQIWSKLARTYASDSPSYHKTYYVVLPQVPKDTPETNTLLRIHGAPEFGKVTPDLIVSGCAKLALTYEVELGKHTEQLEDPNYPKTIESVIEPIEQWQVPMLFGSAMSRQMLYAIGSHYFKEAFQRVSPQFNNAMTDRWNSAALYRAAKELHADRVNLNEFQQRLVDYYRLKGRLNGMELTGKDRRVQIAHHVQVQELMSTFSNRLRISHNLFKYTINDYAQLEGLPESLISLMCVNREAPMRGPWQITLTRNIYEPFMMHCSHRMLRWNTWQAMVSRGSTAFAAQHLSNHILIDKLREHRQDLAQLIGYKTYADMEMETKMAGSVDTVLNFIETLKNKFYPRVEEELGEIQEFARSVEGPSSDLELWDLAYWRKRHCESVFDQIDMPKFTLNNVMSGMFHWCKLLFGVEFQDVTDKVDTWHPTVRCFAVIDSESQEERALVYVDPFLRANKVQSYFTESGRSRSDIIESKPISYVTLNLLPPRSRRIENPLTVKEASRIFYEFGDVLQQCMTEVPYSDLSGQNNIERDASRTCANVMQMIFYQPSVLRTCLHDGDSTEEISDNTIRDIKRLSRHMQYYDLMDELYTSAFDLEMCVGIKYWRECMQKLWPQFNPLTLHKEDEHPCSLSDLFAGDLACAYYSELWSKMLAAEIVETMNQAGFDQPEKIAKVGRRFRDTYLSLGGGVAASDVFRRFQGRDPSIDSLIRYYEDTGES